MALLPLLGASARGQDAPRLTVQPRWRLLAIGLDVGPALRAERLLRRAERGLRRELPGLDVTFDRGRWRDFARPDGAAALDDDALVQAAVTASDEAGLDPAGYDVVFVLSPLWREDYFGHAHIEARDRSGRAVRAARIHTAPGRLIVEGLLRGLERGEARRGELVRALAGVFDRGLALEAVLLPTLAHELGHFFAPGDLDIRDGYQAPWLAHAEGDDDNPAGHEVDCVMFKGRDLAFYVRKALAVRGRLVRFCEPCRTKLGCPPRHR